MKFPRGIALLLVWAASMVVSFPLGAWLGPWAGGIFSGVVCGIAVLAYQWGPVEFLGWLWLELWNLPSTLACLWWDHCTPTGRRARRRARQAAADDPILSPLTGYSLFLLQKYGEGRATGHPEAHPSDLCPICGHSPGIHDNFKHQAAGKEIT